MRVDGVQSGIAELAASLSKYDTVVSVCEDSRAVDGAGVVSLDPCPFPSPIRMSCVAEERDAARGSARGSLNERGRSRFSA